MTYRDPVPPPLCPICLVELDDDTAIKDGSDWYCARHGVMTKPERVRAELEAARTRKQGDAG